MSRLVFIATFLGVLFATAEGVGAFSLQNKTVLVTGSAGGIGKGIAKLFADKGAKIIIHYHTREEEARKFSDDLGTEKCLGILHCDFRDISSIPSFFRKAQELCSEEASQKLDVLVNNAGAITKSPLDADDDTLKIWRDTMTVNLDAPNLLGKLFAEQFQRKSETDATCDGENSIQASEGVILNVGSIHGDRSNEFMGAYAASKAALESLTRTMAIEYSPKGIRANLIAPGIVPVERTERFFARNPSVLKGWTDKLPVGRAGTIEEVAQACLPLIENEWITGTIWQIDGGMMARANMPERVRP